VGVGPKTWARVYRMQRVLRYLRTDEQTWADLAARAGYADQAHLTRELKELTGLTPGAYRRADPRSAHHVPLLEVRFLQDARRPPGP